MTLADKIVVLNGGRVEQVGSPRELYERPASRFVAGFLWLAQNELYAGAPACPRQNQPIDTPVAGMTALPFDSSNRPADAQLSLGFARSTCRSKRLRAPAVSS